MTLFADKSLSSLSLLKVRQSFRTYSYSVYHYCTAKIFLVHKVVTLYDYGWYIKKYYQECIRIKDVYTRLFSIHWLYVFESYEIWMTSLLKINNENSKWSYEELIFLAEGEDYLNISSFYTKLLFSDLPQISPIPERVRARVLELIVARIPDTTNLLL